MAIEVRPPSIQLFDPNVAILFQMLKTRMIFPVSDSSHMSGLCFYLKFRVDALLINLAYKSLHKTRAHNILVGKRKKCAAKGRRVQFLGASYGFSADMLRNVRLACIKG